ncbi:MAG: class I SAM-dependent methyltransferase [Candidatus Hermodarchaeota archaeon]
MTNRNQHYSSENPETDLKVFTLSDSLRKHLYIFKTTTGVFSFKKLDLGTKIFIEQMKIPKEQSTLLDLGCGYGPIGIVLGYESSQSNVYFVDVNRRAIWCTKENIKINLPLDRDRMNVLIGNYLEPIKSKGVVMDAIYMNPPLRQGREDFLNLCKDIPSVLKSGGTFQFVIRKKMGASFILNHLEKTFHRNTLDINILCKRSGYWVFELRFY